MVISNVNEGANPMGSNSFAKKRSGSHYLHLQWVATKTGKEQHKKEIERMRNLPVKAKVYSIGRKHKS